MVGKNPGLYITKSILELMDTNNIYVHTYIGKEPTDADILSAPCTGGKEHNTIANSFHLLLLSGYKGIFNLNLNS